MGGSSSKPEADPVPDIIIHNHLPGGNQASSSGPNAASNEARHIQQQSDGSRWLTSTGPVSALPSESYLSLSASSSPSDSAGSSAVSPQRNNAANTVSFFRPWVQEVCHPHRPLQPHQRLQQRPPLIQPGLSTPSELPGESLRSQPPAVGPPQTTWTTPGTSPSPLAPSSGTSSDPSSGQWSPGTPSGPPRASRRRNYPTRKTSRRPSVTSLPPQTGNDSVPKNKKPRSAKCPSFIDCTYPKKAQVMKSNQDNKCSFHSD